LRSGFRIAVPGLRLPGSRREERVQGLMQDWPLTVDRIIDHAGAWHSAREIVTRTLEGPIARITYAEARRRAKRLSNALVAQGIGPGDRVATLAMNTARHLEAWYGIMGMGAVCHTLNPRLHPDQLVYMLNHAGDRMVMADACFAPLLAAVLPRAPRVEAVVWLADAPAPPPAPAGLGYEAWIAGHPDRFDWGGFDERTAAGLCYTSGTTGDPKGVLYSHRSNVLHSFMALQADVMDLSARDVALVVVPMFHANGWGLPFSCPAVGAKLVLPGLKLDPASLHELIEAEGVTFSAAVPTIWGALLAHLDATGGRLSTLKRVVIGGALCPPALIRGFHDRYGVEVLHGWGMTETSPLGVVGAPSAEMAARPWDEQLPQRCKQGRPPFGIELKVADEAGRSLPRDGRTPGRLMAKGCAVASAYFGREDEPILDGEGFFDTGDIATLDGDGFVQITDRAKDVIKSGGEWISSVEIEGLVAADPRVELCAVIGLPHPRWDERPLLVVKLRPGATATPAEMLATLEGRIARWWTPDEGAFVDDIPLGATGKVDKKLVRARFAGHRLASIAAGETTS
jgi:fatty-acyl-CoA synthase